jgi:hypothetical protein
MQDQEAGSRRRASVRGLWQIILLLQAILFSAAPSAAGLASTPPMGWNSWDAYGFTITEEQFRANVAVLKDLKPYGWSYAVIDEGWYMANPLGDKLATRQYKLDAHGRLEPVTSRFPSAADGKGLKSLADWTHAQGFKFGVHIVRGIPKDAVEANMPIEGSRFRAADAADQADTCPWDDGNYGIADNAAGQAYYDSLIRQYAAWGVDFIKVDCIADHPYRPTEIRQIANALRKVSRPMVLSLSPGPTNISHAAEVAKWSQMWRIADDLWDGWAFPHPNPNTTFPNGVLSAFDNLAKWNAHVRPGNWPDADMLPFGSLAPHPGWGEPRRSRLTQAETRTALTLFAIARSPLILGGNLTEMDNWLRPMLTNRSVIALNQEDRVSRPLASLPAALADAKVWVSGKRGDAPDTVAIFNLSDKPLTLQVPWKAVGMGDGRYSACDLWIKATLEPSEDARFTVGSHDVVLLRVTRGAAKCEAD